jgi:hypothetical protein
MLTLERRDQRSMVFNFRIMVLCALFAFLFALPSVSSAMTSTQPDLAERRQPSLETYPPEHVHPHPRSGSDDSRLPPSDVSYLPLRISLVVAIIPIVLLIFLYLVTSFAQSQHQELDEGPLLRRLHELASRYSLKRTPGILLRRPCRRRNLKPTGSSRQYVILARELLEHFPMTEVDALMERELAFLSREWASWRSGILLAIVVGCNLLGLVALMGVTGVWEDHGMSPVLLIPGGITAISLALGRAIGCWNERRRERRADELIDARLAPEIVRAIRRSAETGAASHWQSLLPRWARPYHEPDARLEHLYAYHSIAPESPSPIEQANAEGRYPLPERLLRKSASSDLHEFRHLLLVIVPLIVLMLLIPAATVTAEFSSDVQPMSYAITLSISSLLLLLCLCVRDYAWSALRRWAVRRRVERISNGRDAEGACAIVGLNPSGMGSCFGSVGRINWDAGWLQIDDGGIHYRSTMAGFRIAWTDITDIRPGIWYIGVCPNHSSRIMWNDSDAREREIILFDLAYPLNRLNAGAVVFHNLIEQAWRSSALHTLKTHYSLDVQSNASGPLSININLVMTLIANAYLPFCLFLAGYPALSPIYISALGAFLPAALALTAHTTLIHLRAWMATRSLPATEP